MNTEKDNHEIYDLLILLLEDDLRDFQRERLVEWSQTDPDAAKEYADFLSYYSIISNEIISRYDSEVGSSSDSQFDRALCQAVDSGSQADIDSNVSLRGIDVTNDVLSDEKEDTVSLDDNIMQALHELAECEATAPTVNVEKPIEEPEEPAGPPVIKPARPERKMSKFSVFTLIFSAAAMLFVVSFVKFSPKPLPSIDIATVTDQMNADWGDSGLMPKTGERLWTNNSRLDLKKGLVRIDFDEGVEVIVEGPALFEMERSGLYLEYGRMYSKVSDTGLGFTVRTPTSQFVDQGTEFCIKAEIDGSSELHVLRGKVQMFIGLKGKSKINQMVTENFAVRYDANIDRVDNIGVQKNSFTRNIDSKAGLRWRGENFDLADVVAGGNGLGQGGSKEMMLDPISRAYVEYSSEIKEYKAIKPTEDRSVFKPVEANPYIDGTFIPSGANGPPVVSSEGHVFSECPNTSGQFSHGFTSGPLGNKGLQYLLSDGTVVNVEDKASIYMHSNLGMTFDLDEIRMRFPGQTIAGFESTCVRDFLTRRKWLKAKSVFIVLVDGQKRYRSKALLPGQYEDVSIDITDKDRFLTLMTIDARDGVDGDRNYFMTPELLIR